MTIVIGDIHGRCADVMDVFDRIGPASDDRIIALGDIVDRGPDSERVLRFFRDRANAASIMGNHERKHIRSARGELQPAVAQIIVRQQLAERYRKWLTFMVTAGGTQIMHPDRIEQGLLEAIIRYCGDLPFPFGTTDFPLQAEWSRILWSCRKNLRLKVISRLTSLGLQSEAVSEKQMTEHADAIVQEGLEILKRPTSSVFKNGGQEFQNWLKR